MSQSFSDAEVLESALDWWRLAGVDWVEPLKPPPPKPSPRPAAGASTQKVRRNDPTEPPPFAAEAVSPTRAVARAADSLEALEAGVAGLKLGRLTDAARNPVFARGVPGAALMVIGEAPGAEEDAVGRPFVGRSGQLLDRMLAAIGLGPEDVYISNILNWRPPGNRTPETAEIAQCLPLIERHIALAAPKVLLLTGGVAAQTLLRTTTGIMRLRGRFHDYALRDPEGAETGETLPALAFLHPAFVLRQPKAKALCWRDFLGLEARLKAL
ncbi:MAG: uracil-DNA glycosylase [Maricaulaceae bacterium]